MGDFGKNNGRDTIRSASDELIDRQLKQNQVEIENKRRILSQERLDIIKSQGGQVWQSKR